MEAVGWRLLVDFAVLTTSIYVVLHWSRQARALRVTFGILVLEAGAWAAVVAGLALTSFVLHGAAIIAVVALIALFQSELRHAINRLEVTAGTSAHRNAALTGLEAIAAAILSLAAAHRGALIVVQRRDSINELIQGGVPLGGQLSVEIREAIFRKVSPVHDGAAVVEGDHITRVGSLLPLSERNDLPRSWGTRHRAGMGLAERSDAVVVGGSEERGDVVVMFDGQFHPIASPSELVVVLRAAGTAPALSPRRPSFDRQELTIFGLAVALAAAIVATLVLAGNTVQVRAVPIEFANVGVSVAGMGPGCIP
jgi:diadenylate cyclase